MTREEASNILDDYDVNFDGHTAEEIAEAFDVAFRALEQEPCEDAIRRQAVLDKKELIELEDGQSFYCISPEDVETLPPVNPKPKTGHWVSEAIQGEIDGQIVKGFTCSKCGAISVFRMTGEKIVNGDYCPNCRTKMVDPQESEDKE